MVDSQDDTLPPRITPEHVAELARGRVLDSIKRDRWATTTILVAVTSLVAAVGAEIILSRTASQTEDLERQIRRIAKDEIARTVTDASLTPADKTDAEAGEEQDPAVPQTESDPTLSPGSVISLHIEEGGEIGVSLDNLTDKHSYAITASGRADFDPAIELIADDTWLKGNDDAFRGTFDSRIEFTAQPKVEYTVFVRDVVGLAGRVILRLDDM